MTLSNLSDAKAAEISVGVSRKERLILQTFGNKFESTHSKKRGFAVCNIPKLQAYLLLLVALTAGCQATDPKNIEPPTSSPIPENINYLQHVQPIIEASCNGCHREGGIAPFSFESPDKVVQLASIIKPSVVSGRMPPFMAKGDCAPYKYDTRLTTAEINTISAWVDAGAPLGDPANSVHAEDPYIPKINRDIILDLGGPFDASYMDSDNYRCFILDPELTEDAFITGYEVIPGNQKIVHHALVYTIPDDRLEEAMRLDAAEPGKGYTCFSNVVADDSEQIAAWVPGQVARFTPENTGLRLPAGKKILMQIHYNLLAAGNDPPIDNTQLALQIERSANLKTATTYSVLQPFLDIPSDTKDVKFQNTLTIPRGGDGIKIHGVTGHMHQLGQSLKMEVIRKSGERECLIDIPSWDFDWQQSFELQSAMQLREGDKVKIECVFDNSQANQPIINGQQVKSRDVSWGEGSLDEMCIGYMLTSF